MANERSRPPSAAILYQLRYLLKLSRPRFWLYLAGPVIVGVTYGAGTTADLLSVPAP